MMYMTQNDIDLKLGILMNVAIFNKDGCMVDYDTLMNIRRLISDLKRDIRNLQSQLSDYEADAGIKY